MIVTTGSFAPRTWSVFDSNGIRDGSSGPGVGCVTSVVQAGGSVGNMMFGGKEGVAMGAEGVDELQEAVMRKIKERGKKKDRSRLMIFYYSMAS